MNHTITDAELAQLREALTFHVEYDGCIECERIRKLLSEIAARTQKPVAWMVVPEYEAMMGEATTCAFGVLNTQPDTPSVPLYLAPQPAAPKEATK